MRRGELAVSSVLGRGYCEFPQHFPQARLGRARPRGDLGVDATWPSARRSTAAARKARELAAIGITNQRETTGLWDARRASRVHRAIVWQDRRTADVCARPAATRATSELIAAAPAWCSTRTSPAPSSPGCSTTCRACAARAERGELRFGTIDTWLVCKLTGGAVHVTDATNASRTLLFDIRRAAPGTTSSARSSATSRASLLPEVRGSSEVYGTTRGLGFLPDGIPIAGIAGDQQAALFGQACFAPGMAKCTYGTGAFVLVNTGERRRAERARPADHHRLAARASTTTYALEGSAFIAGAVVQWLRDGLGFFTSSAEIEALAALGPRHRRRRARAGAHRPRRAALAAGGARHHHRPDARHDPRPPRPRRARGHRLADRRPARAPCAPTRGQPLKRAARRRRRRRPTTC